MDLFFEKLGPKGAEAFAQTPGGVEVIVLFLDQETDELTSAFLSFGGEACGSGQKQVAPARQEPLAVAAGHRHGDAGTDERHHPSVAEAFVQCAGNGHSARQPIMSQDG